MKTTHFRFRTPCYGRIYGDSVFEGTPYEKEWTSPSTTRLSPLTVIATNTSSIRRTIIRTTLLRTFASTMP